MKLLLLLPMSLLACGPGKVRFDDLESAEDVVDACEQAEPETITLEVVFPAQADACPWGEDDNLEAEGGVFTARVEQLEQLELPEQSVICDMSFDFSSLVPGEVQVMIYDDHFFFTFNDVVLAASYGPAVAGLEEDESTRLYDWADVVGSDYHVDEAYEPYCLGDETNESRCDIPDTEVEGPISLIYGDALVSQLSYRAIEAGRYDFGFVTTGDNNEESDCQHEEFGFTIEVPYLAL